MKDFFGFFSSKVDSDTKLDYIITFNNERPNISNNDNLKSLGTWTEYGTHGYRIWCALSKEKFEELISNELEIDRSSFKVIRSSEFAGFSL